MSSSTPSVDPPPSGVSGGAIAGVFIAAEIVIILTVIVTVVVAVIVYRKGLCPFCDLLKICHVLL